MIKASLIFLTCKYFRWYFRWLKHLIHVTVGQLFHYCLLHIPHKEWNLVAWCYHALVILLSPSLIPYNRYGAMHSKQQIGKATTSIQDTAKRWWSTFPWY
jgi:hypothetical protein